MALNDDTLAVRDVTEPVMDDKCGRCVTSICCNSINQRVETPRSIRDFDHLLWQVSHENVNVFRDADGWFLNIITRCQHLLADGACGIYDSRPFICRDYKNDFCEFDEPISEGAEMFFDSYEALDRYCRNRFKTWDRRFDP